MVARARGAWSLRRRRASSPKLRSSLPRRVFSRAPRAAGIRQHTLGIRRILGAVIARFGAGSRAAAAGGGAAGEAAQARPALRFLPPRGVPPSPRRGGFRYGPGPG